MELRASKYAKNIATEPTNMFNLFWDFLILCFLIYFQCVWQTSNLDQIPIKYQPHIIAIIWFLMIKDLNLLIFHDSDKYKKMRDVRTSRFHPFSRRHLCYVSENDGFRFVKKVPVLIASVTEGSKQRKISENWKQSVRKSAFCVLYTQEPTKLVASKLKEVATKLDPLRISCASPASPQASIKESTKEGGRRR